MIKRTIRKVLTLFKFFNLNKKIYRNPLAIEYLFEKYKSKEGITKSLDIGSGPTPKNPFKAVSLCGADIRENKINNVAYADFSGGCYRLKTTPLTM